MHRTDTMGMALSLPLVGKSTEQERFKNRSEMTWGRKRKRRTHEEYVAWMKREKEKMSRTLLRSFGQEINSTVQWLRKHKI